MGVTNRDSSALTMKRRGIAENSYYTQWKAATVNNSNPQQGLKAPAAVSAAVVTEIALGCSTCASGGTDPNNATYPFNPSSGGAGRSY
jgi:hypothetical protein